MLKEIGVKRLMKYLIYGAWDTIFRLLPWSPLRVLWMNIGGAHISWSAVVDKVSFMNLDRTGLSGLTVEDKAFLGCQSVIDLAGTIVIQRSATISPAVVLLSHFSVGFSDHPLIKQYPKRVEKTVVEEGAFVGAHATILSGVTIGKNSLVAAGSVVTNDVPCSTLVAGNPARVKKQL